MEENTRKFIGALVREESLEDRNELIRKSADGIADWPRMFLLLRNANILPLLYPPLKSGLIPSFPAALVDRVRSEYFRIGALNELFAMEYKEISAALNRAGINPAPIKGLELAWALYPDPALRPMQDMDLLLKREEAVAAREILEQRGYSVVERYNFQRAPEAEYEIPMIKPGRPSIQVELHWDLIDRSGIKTRFRGDPDLYLSGVRERFVPGELQGRPVNLLCPEDNLLVVAFHVAKHSLRLCQSVPDFYRLVARHQGNLDWNKFLAIAAKAGMKRPLFYALETIRSIGGSVWPESVMDDMSPPAADLKLFDLVIRNRGQGKELDELLFWLWLEPGAQRVKAALRYLVPNRDQISNALGYNVSPTAYPLELGRRYSRWAGNIAGIILKRGS